MPEEVELGGGWMLLGDYDQFAEFLEAQGTTLDEFVDYLIQDSLTEPEGLNLAGIGESRMAGVFDSMNEGPNFMEEYFKATQNDMQFQDVVAALKNPNNFESTSGDQSANLENFVN